MTFKGRDDEALRRLEMKVGRLEKEIKGGGDQRFFYINMAGFGFLAFVLALLAYQALGSSFMLLPTLLAAGAAGITALNVFLLFRMTRKPEKGTKEKKD